MNNNNFRRNNFSGRRDHNFNREEREKHKAICTECKQECEVPFKPTEGKDVFCTKCWAKKRPPRYQ